MTSDSVPVNANHIPLFFTPDHGWNNFSGTPVEREESKPAQVCILANQVIEEMKATEIPVFLVLAFRADARGEVYISIRSISEIAGVSGSAVKQRLKCLKDRSIVSWRHTYDVFGGRGPSLYKLLCAPWNMGG